MITPGYIKGIEKKRNGKDCGREEESGGDNIKPNDTESSSIVRNLTKSRPPTKR